ncbi:MAG: DUF882 domain-containing protein [Bradyrhizobium icense]|nr:MAG: DUF882 domain-containing protein [Bradyrhizobium icense]
MLAVFARQIKPLCSQRACFRAGLASVLLLGGAGAVRDATALNETRTLTFHHTHSGEDLTVTFKRNGRYDEESLKQLNHFLRDWRTQEKTEMDRRLFDILWEVYRDVDGKQPINIISSYRSPATNAMLRRRSSGVARHSQHMLGHAMDFYIPGVALTDVRAAGLRLQRGGVGFYPTSGSPFVHLDTGSVRHWPRMSPDQLAKVFPDGRTVHQSTSGPMKGYELAKADIERRGDGEETQAPGKRGFLASLFKGNAANDEDDEGSAPAPAPVKNEKPVKTTVVAATAPAKPAEKPVKPAASTLQLASADAKIVPAPKTVAVAAAASATAETKPQGTVASQTAPQTPADIINARGFWDNIPAPQQATPAQVAALSARKAVASADPQPTASLSESFNKAMAYAPAAASPVDRANIVAASAPIPRSGRPSTPSRNSMAVTDVTTVIAKSGQGGTIANSARLAASKGDNELWLRVIMLAPSASTSMSVTVFGDADLTLMRQHFVKPQAIVAMTFSNDPTLGLVTDRFTGSATARLDTMSFVMRTAALR